MMSFMRVFPHLMFVSGLLPATLAAQIVEIVDTDEGVPICIVLGAEHEPDDAVIFYGPSVLNGMLYQVESVDGDDCLLHDPPVSFNPLDDPTLVTHPERRVLYVPHPNLWGFPQAIVRYYLGEETSWPPSDEIRQVHINVHPVNDPPVATPQVYNVWPNRPWYGLFLTFDDVDHELAELCGHITVLPERGQLYWGPSQDPAHLITDSNRDWCGTRDFVFVTDHPYFDHGEPYASFSYYVRDPEGLYSEHVTNTINVFLPPPGGPPLPIYPPHVETQPETAVEFELSLDSEQWVQMIQIEAIPDATQGLLEAWTPGPDVWDPVIVGMQFNVTFDPVELRFTPATGFNTCGLTERPLLAFTASHTTSGFAVTHPDTFFTELHVIDTCEHPVGGTVAGLSGTGLVLDNNGVETLELHDDGEFTFPTPLAHGTAYQVSISAQPADHVCSLSKASGTTLGTINDIEVHCLMVENGQCGPATGGERLFAPTTGLCATGSPTLPLADDTQQHWSWQCEGLVGGDTASCQAPWLTISPPDGRAGVWVTSPDSVPGGGLWSVDTETSQGIVSLADLEDHDIPGPPAGWEFPVDLLGMTLVGGMPGSDALLNVTYPQTLPADAVYAKYDPLQGWHLLPPERVNLSGNSVSLHLTDWAELPGVGDSDPTWQRIVVPGGVMVPKPLISLAPAPLQFVGVAHGESATALLVMENAGAGTLTPVTIGIEGADAALFGISANACDEAQLAGGESCAVEIDFAPTAPGQFQAVLRIDSNADSSPDFVELHGSSDVIFFDAFDGD